MLRDRLVRRLTERLEKKLESTPTLVKDDDEIIIDSAIEALRATNEQNVPKALARKTLEEVKQEDYESSFKGRLDKVGSYFRNRSSSIKIYLITALTVGIFGFGLEKIATSSPEPINSPPPDSPKPSVISSTAPSGFIEGEVIEESSRIRVYEIGVKASSYTIDVKTSKGIYKIDFYYGVDTQGRTIGNRRSVLHLSEKIDIGDKIRFPNENLRYGKFNGFSGNLRPEHIKILGY